LGLEVIGIAHQTAEHPCNPYGGRSYPFFKAAAVARTGSQPSQCLICLKLKGYAAISDFD
jgi:hypothetical protein